MNVGLMNEKGYRACPGFGKSIGKIRGGRKAGGTTSIEWKY
jgi:hypothetical protein